MSDLINQLGAPAATWDEAEKTWSVLSAGMRLHAGIVQRPVEVCVVHSLLSTIKRRDAEIARLQAQKGGA